MGRKLESAEVLVKLGLTPNEAKIFSTLNRMEKLTAKTIAQRSGVAREVVYKSLKNLKNKGFVEEILSSPKTFRTIPEEDAYEIMLQQKEKEHHELKEEIQQALKNKKATKVLQTTHDEEVVSFSPEKTNYRLKRCWFNVENSVDMIIPCKKFVRWGKYDMEEYLHKSMENKVTIQVVTEKETEKHMENKDIFTPSLMQKLNRVNFKFVESLPEVEMIIFDKKHINIAIKKEDQIKDMQFLSSNNRFLAEVANKYFENLWCTR